MKIRRRNCLNMTIWAQPALRINVYIWNLDIDWYWENTKTSWDSEGTVQPKILNLSLFTHNQVVPNLYDFMWNINGYICHRLCCCFPYNESRREVPVCKVCYTPSLMNVSHKTIVLNAEVNLGITTLYCTLQNVDIHLEIC